jgi:DNA-binding XRE family transcriptional regulator
MSKVSQRCRLPCREICWPIVTDKESLAEDSDPALPAVHRTWNGISNCLLVSVTIVSELFEHTAKRCGVPKPIGADRPRLNKTLTQALGTTVTNLRVSKGWTQDELAYRTGYDTGYVRRVERGTANPSFQLLYNISDVFALPLSVLIARAEGAAKKAKSAELSASP